MNPFHHHPNIDPLMAGVATAAASVGGAAAVVAQSAVTDGLDPTTGWAGGIIVGGVAVFGLWYRFWAKGEAERNAERRKADAEKDQRIHDLEAEVLELRQDYETELRDLRTKYEALLRGENT